MPGGAPHRPRGGPPRIGRAAPPGQVAAAITAGAVHRLMRLSAVRAAVRLASHASAAG
jgi:hypothetical protein